MVMPMTNTGKVEEGESLGVKLKKFFMNKLYLSCLLDIQVETLKRQLDIQVKFGGKVRARGRDLEIIST